MTTAFWCRPPILEYWPRPYNHWHWDPQAAGWQWERQAIDSRGDGPGGMWRGNISSSLMKGYLLDSPRIRQCNADRSQARAHSDILSQRRSLRFTDLRPK